MFDFGFGELLLLAVIALVVLGPERLPVAARLAGVWIRKARAQWNSVKAEMENELADEDLRRNLREASEAMRDSAQQMRGFRDDVASGAAQMTRLAPPVPAPVSPTSPPRPASVPAAPETPADPPAVVRDPTQLSLLGIEPDLPEPAPPSVQPRADG